MSQDLFKPKILGFLCNWCCYTAADSAGVARYQYPPNIRVIRVMCAGRIDPIFILEAFSCGADGVFVGGCHLGECHYQTGNYEALVVAELTRKLLEKAGVSTERFLLEWASAAEGPRFVEIITNFTDKIKNLGPLEKAENKDKDELMIKILAAKSAAKQMKLRAKFGKIARELRKEGDYSNQIIHDKLDQKVAGAINTEIAKQETLLRIQKDGPVSFDDLGEKIGVTLSEIEKYVSAFSKKGLVSEIDGRLSATSNQ
ncbi:MAG: hydrogenase iron-sulfur subunit [Deltaproteobacteria bacterium]|nr:hydrogenase iron-sulfur subunit [Deltaproteobacteria bacterium]MBW2661864.1 hydrogenase iron-sulfur subunit [Deltaproteobacteria bacterium]